MKQRSIRQMPGTPRLNFASRSAKSPKTKDVSAARRLPKLSEDAAGTGSVRKQCSLAAFNEIVALIETSRREAGRAVNVQLIELYWKIGAVISTRIDRDGWGKGTVAELASHLAGTQAGARGFSPQNLWRMRQFFEADRRTPNLSTALRVVQPKAALPSKASLQ